MIAGGNVIIQDNNEFTNGYCIFGKCEVIMSQGNEFETTHQLFEEDGITPILDDAGNPIMVSGTQVAVGPENNPECTSWAPSEFPGLEVDSPGAENCGLLGTEDGGVCDPPQCGDLSESQASCAWLGSWDAPLTPWVGPPPPVPTPELAEYWTENMFPNIGDLPSMTLPLDPDDPAFGAITAIDLTGFSDAETVTKDELAAYFADATEDTCQTRRNKVYVVSGNDSADFGNVKICDVVIIASKITTGTVTLDNVALIAGDPDNETNNPIEGANVELGTGSSFNNVLLAARGTVSVGKGAVLGDLESCGGEFPTIQLFALDEMKVGSDSVIFNGDIVSAGDLLMGSNLDVSLTGTGTTVQSLGNVTVQSDGKFGGCPEDIIADANADDPEIAVILRLVN